MLSSPSQKTVVAKNNKELYNQIKTKKQANKKQATQK
jgi:hypothetical protein